MSNGTGSGRSLKRSRSASQIDEPDPGDVRSAIEALLERLVAIRTNAEASRGDHLVRIRRIDDRIAAKQTASRALARVSAPSSSNNELAVFSRGVSTAGSSVKVPRIEKPALSPMKLLMESETPEKVIHEQSVIARAQAINRRNAELARERLPKQPEAQRNKTHWDYLLDEAAWLATDFREERKWKMAIARRLAKACASFHTQKMRRRDRAIKEEQEKTRRAATAVARGVRRFWAQIREIAELRVKEVEAVRLKEQRNHQLEEVLQEAGQLANALSASYVQATEPSDIVDTVVENAENLASSNSVKDSVPVASGRDSAVDELSVDEGYTHPMDVSSGSENYSGEHSDVEDDEETIEVAEAEDGNDPNETMKLKADADIPVSDILRSRGIDPSSYGVKEVVAEEGADTPNEKRVNGIVTHSNGNGEVNAENSEPLSKTEANGTSTPPVDSTETKDEAMPPTGDDPVPMNTEQLPSEQPSLPRAESSKPAPPTRLLKGTLRNYQLEGMQWLVALYKKNMNGMLADEMGLGKTIQTIALLAWLALEKGIWGPHLIVVPTSVMVNWEVELKKWLPAFKVMTYFGSQRERKLKRVGWTRPNSFHVCITSYTLVVQDAASLKRKEWVYLILDEAHNIKNFQSQRWQVLLRFPSVRRLLLTGTPLQNSIMELWSLLHFLMPTMFESQAEFKDWFYKPLSSMVSEDSMENSKQMVAKLHDILRPFLMRRLKKDVEGSLRPKVEHVLKCPLSKRQRQLYEDFLSRSETQSTLEHGDFFGVMGVLMQLRKVCNHPDLFEGRPILSPISMKPVFYPVPSLVLNLRSRRPFSSMDLSLLSLDLATEERNGWPGQWHASEVHRLSCASIRGMSEEAMSDLNTRPEDVSEAAAQSFSRRAIFRRSVLRYHARLTAAKSRQRALLGEDKIMAVSLEPRQLFSRDRRSWKTLSCRGTLIKSLESRAGLGTPLFERFVCCIRKVDAPIVELRFAGDDHYRVSQRLMARKLTEESSSLTSLFRVAYVRSSVTLPDSRLVQWDCGKLQALDRLLRQLRSRGSRVLIYSQMSKVLNILESFLNLHAIRYLRLDGSTKTDERQRLVERFNTDSRIFCMILTTRAGGVGLNLTGADTVVFYDTDYNPAIDAQAQDRVHRIGQKKEVHIYRLVSEKTVEENILKRANEKRTLESIVISQAGFDIDSIRRRAGIDDLVQTSFGNASSPAQFVEGLKKTSALNASSIRSVGHSSTSGTVPKPTGSSYQLPKNVPLLAAHGPLQPIESNGSTQAVNLEANAVPKAVAANGDSKNLRDLAEDSDAYNTLLMQEEKQVANDEALEASAEFLDSPGSKSPTAPKPKNDGRSVNKIEGSLTPIQRFALKFVEIGLDSRNLVLDIEEPPDGDGEEQGATTNGLATKEESDEEDAPVLKDESDHEDTNGLFYEQSPGQTTLSSLKALTDTDANIKLYLPLRDGGPEELNVSTVVNGTAAAGLECAEDAAFFPHAYNRMSRTIHATMRQREKAAYNLRRREELEAKKRRDANTIAAQRAAAQGLAGQADYKVRNGGVRVKDEVRGVGLPPAKRARTESTPGTGVGGEGMFPGTNGLFKKNAKRNQRKTTSRYSKSSLSLNQSAPLGEGIGKNDGWTKEEELRLIELMKKFGNNMAVVCDVLNAHPDVNAGNRRRRNLKQLCDRWYNSIIKEHKNSAPAPTTTSSDAEVFKRNLEKFVEFTGKMNNTSRGFDPKSTPNTEVHKSHARVTAEANKNPITRLDRSAPPSFPDFADKVLSRGGASPAAKPSSAGQKKSPFLRSINEFHLVPLQNSTRPAWNAAVARAGHLNAPQRPVIRPQPSPVPIPVQHSKPPGNKIVSFQEAAKSSSAAKAAALAQQKSGGAAQVAQKQSTAAGVALGAAGAQVPKSTVQYGVLQPAHAQNGMRRVAHPPPTKVPTTAAAAQPRGKAIPAGVNHVAKAAALPPTTAAAHAARLQQRAQAVSNKGQAVAQARPAALAQVATARKAGVGATKAQTVANAALSSTSAVPVKSTIVSTVATKTQVTKAQVAHNANTAASARPHAKGSVRATVAASGQQAGNPSAVAATVTQPLIRRPAVAQQQSNGVAQVSQPNRIMLEKETPKPATQ